MAKKIKVCLSDSSLNSYGIRVITEGINIEQYKKNPILLWMHNRAFRGTKDEVLPLGHVEELEVTDGKLYGVPVIEPVDDFSSNVLKLWENGTIKAVSISIDDCVYSEDPKDLVPGQTRATVKSCSLQEVSIVDIGSNDNALQMYQDGKKLKLSKVPEECDIPLIKLNHKKTMGTNEGNAPAGAGAPDNNELLNLRKENSELRTSLEKLHVSMANTTVSQAVKDGKIKETEKEKFINLAKTQGVDVLNEIIQGIATQTGKPASKPLDFVKNENPAEGAWKKLHDVPADKIFALRRDQPELYKQLYKAQYGIDCNIE